MTKSGSWFPVVCLVAVAVTAAGGAAAEPADGPLREVRLLLDGRVRPGAWTAVLATVEAAAAPLQEELSVRAGPARYAKPLSVPAGTRQVCLLPVFIPPAVPIPQVSLSGGGPAGGALEPVVHEVPPGELLIGVDPARAAKDALILSLREVLPGDRPLHWVPLALSELQEAPEVLDALDGVVCEEAVLMAHPALEAYLGVWLGRGGRLFRDAASARRAAAEGWNPLPRAPEGVQPVLTDLLPRGGAPPRRVHRGRIALGILLALGAAAVVLVGWQRLPRGANAAVLAGFALAGVGIAALLVPVGGAAARGAAVREIVFPEGPAGRRMAEAVEGFVALDAPGAAEVRVEFPPRTRVSVAAPSREQLPREPVEIVPRDGGWSVRARFAAAGRRILRFSRHGPAGEWIFARIVREGGAPVRVGYETLFDEDLADVQLAIGGSVYPMDAIPAKPPTGERKAGAGPVERGEFLRQSWPPGDPRRALREWWGPRMASGSWLLATSGETPLTLANPDLEMEWAPVLVAVRIEN